MATLTLKEKLKKKQKVYFFSSDPSDSSFSADCGVFLIIEEGTRIRVGIFF
jgi:hypothetical protein